MNLSMHIQTNCLSPSSTDMMHTYVQQKRQYINDQDIQNWSNIQSLNDWQTFVQPRIEALRQSLGHFPSPPTNLNTHTTSTLQGEGYTIENLVFESRPNIYVSANLYCPNPLHDSMPGILLIHSHHNPKTQGELQDMGILWARAGCLVLVIDQFAYGDRRDHSFAPRQDYWFRSITGHQLYTMGDSLMGWMVWDIHRGIDLLLSRPNIDSNAIITMGAVAGGGDPCAVAAALDERITCAVPFNFGGPQPESPYPLPNDAANTFNYLGSGGWETTRNLYLSGRGGFLPWVIVGAIAPRKLIYAHEFEWDQDRDPVWQRLQQIYTWHNAIANLDYAKGFGQLKERPPQASHCNNIGIPHRQRIYGALNRWYDIPTPTQEVEERFEAEQLQSLTPQFRQQHKVPPIHTVLLQIGLERSKKIKPQRKALQDTWTNHLGLCVQSTPDVQTHSTEETNDIKIERIVFSLGPTIKLPCVLLTPQNQDPNHLVIAMAQAGKSALLSARSEAYHTLLKNGIAICLPDLRGTGETAPNEDRGFRSTASSLSANAWLFGQTMLGLQLGDLRTLIAYFQNRFEHISLWGDSLANTNPTPFQDPLLNEAPLPHQAEPLGGLLALLGALFVPKIKAVVASGTFTNFLSLLNNTYCYASHDAIIPGAITAGDLQHITTTLGPMPLRLENLVDGQNCLAEAPDIYQTYTQTQEAYAQTPHHLCIDPNEKENTATWLIHHLTSE